MEVHRAWQQALTKELQVFHRRGSPSARPTQRVLYLGVKAFAVGQGSARELPLEPQTEDGCPNCNNTAVFRPICVGFVLCRAPAQALFWLLRFICVPHFPLLSSTPQSLLFFLLVPPKAPQEIRILFVQAGIVAFAIVSIFRSSAYRRIAS